MTKTYLKDLTPDEVIRRLKAGEVVKHDNGNYEKKLIEGIICTAFNSGGFVVNDALSDNGSEYFETPDELKLEVGKCYKTRDGRKAFVSYYDRSENEYCGCIEKDKGATRWLKNGLWYENEENDPDIISEWSDDDVAED